MAVNRESRINIESLSCVLDGDYVTLRNFAWKGVYIQHTISNDEIKGTKKTAGPLSMNEQANAFTFEIRRVIFNEEINGFILPSLPGTLSQRRIITLNDFVIFIIPNTSDRVMGTRNPPIGGNNGDYRVSIQHFPIITQNDLISATASPIELARNFFTGGFWNTSKGQVDVLNQSRCVWGFHTINKNNSSINQINVQYNAPVINIRNMWTSIKSDDSFFRNFTRTGIFISAVIQSTFNGGRNLTQASGSNGRVVKLALSNKDTDDKAGWVVDPWNGKSYPIPRVFTNVNSDNPTVVPNNPPTQNGIPSPSTQPSLPPADSGELVYDPNSRTYRPKTLALKTQTSQDKRTIFDKILKYITGKYWSEYDILGKASFFVSIIIIILGIREIKGLFSLY